MAKPSRAGDGGSESARASCRLVLGTAQFSGQYGILSSHGSAPDGTQDQSESLLFEAARAGICALDTAPSYGSAEKFIGSSGWEGAVWTKLDPSLDPEQSVAESLTKLRRSWIDVLFIHDVSRFLSSGPETDRRLSALRGKLVGHLGVSVYEPQEVVLALQRIDFDVVQVPLNVFDTRFERFVADGSWPGTPRLVARSVFLQGLLAQPESLPGNTPSDLVDALMRWSQWCVDAGVVPGYAALAWALSRSYVDNVIIGVETTSQLSQVLSWNATFDTHNFGDEIPIEDLWPSSDPRAWSGT